MQGILRWYMRRTNTYLNIFANLILLRKFNTRGATSRVSDASGFYLRAIASPVNSLKLSAILEQMRAVARNEIAIGNPRYEDTKSFQWCRINCIHPCASRGWIFLETKVTDNNLIIDKYIKIKKYSWMVGCFKTESTKSKMDTNMHFSRIIQR